MPLLLKSSCVRIPLARIMTARKDQVKWLNSLIAEVMQHCLEMQLVISSDSEDEDEREFEEQPSEIFNQEVTNDLGERLTPLLIAIREGHYKVVKLLVERYGANVNKCGAIRIDCTLVDNASPLWVAAGSGCINIVKDLVEAGAVINHRTDTGSTPIRAACFDGQLEIVQYLVHCGADIEIPNAFDNTCLMIACYRGHFDTVGFLLDCGADPNKKALCGATALHFAAESGTPALIQRLLDAGSVVTKTNKGFTPVMLAAEQARKAAVEIFIQRPEFGLNNQEIIDALELLGASFANDQKNYSLDLCMTHLKLAMQLRYKDPSNPILKPQFPPVPAYGNRLESQTMEDLLAIEDDPDAIHMEALIIRERLLGPDMSCEATIPIVYRGVILAEEGRFDLAIALWLHRLDLLQAVNSCVSRDILRFTQVFSRILAHQHKVELEDLMKVLRAAYVDLKRKKMFNACESYHDKKGIEGERDAVLFSTMELLVIATIISKDNEVLPTELNKIVFDLLKLECRNSSGQSLLHLATDSSTRVNSVLTLFGVKFPYEPLATLLIDCGANVNAVDDSKSTPLHLVVAPMRHVRDFGNIHKIINKLVEHGAHLDAVNIQGRDPYECTSSLFVQLVLKSFCSVKPLKCLAARAICESEIEVPSFLPQGLKDFIQIHGTETSETSSD